MNNDIIIRQETPEDYRAVENLVRESFWNVYRPGCQEHYVLHCLRDDPAFVPELDFVMEKGGELIGQNMFMRAHIQADDGRQLPIMTMGPICIAPAYKRQGYGKMLLDYSLEKARAFGCPALCFEGNILFYGKSGLTYASDYHIRYHDLPEGADASFFLCKELIPGYLGHVSGLYGPPEGYFVAEKNPEAFEAFDAQFPRKEPCFVLDPAGERRGDRHPDQISPVKNFVFRGETKASRPAVLRPALPILLPPAASQQGFFDLTFCTHCS